MVSSYHKMITRNIFLLVILQAFAIINVFSAEKPCNSDIYCYGQLLHTIQMSGIFPDGKTFVDRPLKYNPVEVQRNFSVFMRSHNLNPNKNEILNFVESNFYPNGYDIETFVPEDFHENPKFLERISDVNLRTWANDLHKLWEKLGRRVKLDVKQNPNMYSMIYVPNLFIIPGSGRFREYYYWDSFWIQRGLLISEMYETVRSMLENFLYLVEKFGFIPNGGRVYYSGRSQPPLLIPMVKSYYEVTKDKEFIRNNYKILEKEFQFWITQRNVTIIGRNGKSFTLARYNSEITAPRPEEYRVDYLMSSKLETMEEKLDFYYNMHSTGESGWDFSSRWFSLANSKDKESRIDTKTRYIVPVDLNGILYGNAKILYEFATMLKLSESVARYRTIILDFQESFGEVFWDEDEGIWFDYDIIHKTLRKEFYPSSIIPLFAELPLEVNDEIRAFKYFKNSIGSKFPGGIPTSLIESGEQWDFPNGWAPLQYFVIDAFSSSTLNEAKEYALNLAEKWILSTYEAYKLYGNKMFEKYNVTGFGLPGGGGEYPLEIGFGWTNGVVLELLNRYGSTITTQKKLSRNNIKQGTQSDQAKASQTQRKLLHWILNSLSNNPLSFPY